MKNVFKSLLLGAIILFASAVPSKSQSIAEGAWRGFMGVPNGEEFGFVLTVDDRDGGPVGRLAPDPVPNEQFNAIGLEVTDDLVSFRWQPGSFMVRCVLESEGDGTYYGACTESSGKAGPAVLARPGVRITKARLSWERLRDRLSRSRDREMLDRIDGPRGEKIDVGGYNVYALAEGSGAPTVVFVSGLGDDLRTWDYVHYDVQAFTSALSYTRSGLGYSDPNPQNRSIGAVVEELRTVLANADAPSPYVLVGHGLGSVFVRAYAEKYPTAVAGLVLLDPVHELEGRRYSELDAASWDEYLDRQETLYSLAPDAAAQEFEIYRDMVENGRIEGVGSLPDVPTVVVTSTKRPERERWIGDTEAGLQVKHELHEQMIGDLSWARHVVAEKSAGIVQREAPDLVLDAIRDVFDAVEKQRSSAN